MWQSQLRGKAQPCSRQHRALGDAAMQMKKRQTTILVTNTYAHMLSFGAPGDGDAGKRPPVDAPAGDVTIPSTTLSSTPRVTSQFYLGADEAISRGKPPTSWDTVVGVLHSQHRPLRPTLTRLQSWI